MEPPSKPTKRKPLSKQRIFRFQQFQVTGKRNSRLTTCSDPGAMTALKPFHPKESIHSNLFGNAMKEPRGPFCYVRTYVRKCVLYRTRVEPFHLRILHFPLVGHEPGGGREAPVFVESGLNHFIHPIFLALCQVWARVGSGLPSIFYVLLLRSASPPAPGTGACPREPRLHQCFIPGP